jgi:hypothetical protein
MFGDANGDEPFYLHYLDMKTIHRPGRSRASTKIMIFGHVLKMNAVG